MTVEEVRGSLDLTDNGAIKNSIRNCLTVFQNDPVLQGAVRYNILTERIDIVKPLWWSKQTATLTDTDLNYLMLYLEDKYSLTSEKKIQKALSIIADSNKYHPIRDYLNGLEWDGTERIRYALPRFLGAEEGEYTYQALRLFMLGAISRVFKPGCKFEVMLCLVGGQGAGKSTFFRLLAVKDEWFSDDLKKIDDDNVYRKMQGHWIIEMSEMIATANAKSIEDIKSFISRAKETYKVPYETHPADRLRQCVFGGSSNTMDFLPLDRSGNRRFLPIMVHPENAEIHILEDEAASRAFIDLMWAEAMFIYHNFPVRLTLSKDMDKELKELQNRLGELHNRLYRKKVPVIIAYEGWDAAGKGGNIKRIAGALDPRGYEVHPIASPEPHEKARHYLWRFWTRLPKTGHIAIFDRTWYGRVMVERLEGFCSENDWMRAYNEINEFEKELHDWGAVIIKFWVQIDKDTQLERFNERQNTPEKQWKITDEDWRNRDKWDAYETAVNEMIQKTSTSYAPWHILESVDKKYARIKALKIVVEELEKVLG